MSESDPTTILNAAQALQNSLANAHLNISKSQIQFDEHTSPSADDTQKVPLLFADTGGLVDPASVELDVTAQLAFFRKLKFQYLEQKAKDQYIKIIVSDDAPSITAADNESLRLTNEKRKQELKARKVKLAETHNNIRTLAPLVEQDYVKAKALTNEASNLARQILDARLALTRLRKAHPHPRLTVPRAEAQLDAQVAEMQTLDDQLQEVNENVASVKEHVKEGAKEVERMRIQRAEVERERDAKVGRTTELKNVVGMYDWYTAALHVHNSLHSLISFDSPSENELHLVYSLPSAELSSSTFPRELSIVLLFHPNTRQLADAQIVVTPSPSNANLDEELSDLIAAYTQSNDVAGLVQAILARARAEWR